MVTLASSFAICRQKKRIKWLTQHVSFVCKLHGKGAHLSEFEVEIATRIVNNRGQGIMASIPVKSMASVSRTSCFNTLSCDVRQKVTKPLGI